MDNSSSETTFGSTSDGNVLALNDRLVGSEPWLTKPDVKADISLKHSKIERADQASEVYETTLLIHFDAGCMGEI